MKSDRGKLPPGDKPYFRTPKAFERCLQDTEREKIRLTLDITTWQREMQSFEQHIQLVHPSLVAVLLDNDHAWQQRLAGQEGELYHTAD